MNPRDVTAHSCFPISLWFRQGPLGPLGVARQPSPKTDEKGDEEDSPSRPAKRAKVIASSTASAIRLPAEDAESVCYGVQLAGMPGKFDNAAATRLGVPMGPMRGQLVRGQDVTLEDGRVIKSSECVGSPETGLRFIIVDCPTMAHLAELVRPDSPAGVAMAALSNPKKGNDAGMSADEGGEVGNLAVVVHLAPAEVAKSSEYAAWMQSCAAFRNADQSVAVRHLMVHGDATCRNPVFRASARVASRLHAVDGGVFPEPLFSTTVRLAATPELPEPIIVFTSVPSRALLMTTKLSFSQP